MNKNIVIFLTFLLFGCGHVNVVGDPFRQYAKQNYQFEGVYQGLDFYTITDDRLIEGRTIWHPGVLVKKYAPNDALYNKNNREGLVNQVLTSVDVKRIRSELSKSVRQNSRELTVQEKVDFANKTANAIMQLNSQTHQGVQESFGNKSSNSNRRWRVEAQALPHPFPGGYCRIKEISEGFNLPNGDVRFNIHYECKHKSSGTSGMGTIICGKSSANYEKQNYFTARCY